MDLKPYENRATMTKLDTCVLFLLQEKRFDLIIK